MLHALDAALIIVMWNPTFKYAHCPIEARLVRQAKAGPFPSTGFAVQLHTNGENAVLLPS